MSEIKTGGPAFPLQSIGPDFAPGYSGMTLRDYFAAKAMQGDVNRAGYYGRDDLMLRQAENAYKLADAMIKAREAK